MVSVVAGGLFNAIAFAGAGYVFHKLDKNGYEAEIERHDKAMEEFNKEKEKWYEKTVEKKSKIALLRQKLSDANKDLDEVNDALHNLRMAEEDLQETQEPKFSDYYKPSEEMKMYMETFTGELGIGTGYLAAWLLL